MSVFTRAVRNVARRKVRVLLVVFALAFSMAIMISLPAGILANQAATEQISENYNSYIIGMEEEINKTLTLIECSLSGGFGGGGEFKGFGGGGGMMFSEETFLNDTALEDINTLEGVLAVLPFLEKTEGTVQIRETPRGSFEMLVPDYTIVGVLLDGQYVDDYVVLPNTVLEGRTLQDGDSGVVLLSVNNTEYFGVGIGDDVTILGNSFDVVGVYETSDRLGMRNLYMNISDAQKITNLSDQISRIDVYAEDQDSVAGLVDEINTLYPEFYLTTYEERLSQIERMQDMYQTTLETAKTALDTTQAVAYQEIGIAVGATSLIVLFTMLYTVRERTREIGILKAIGFSNGSIMTQFMLEGVLMSILAGIVGIIISTIGAPILSSLLLPSATSGTPMTGIEGRRVNVIPGLSLSSEAVVAIDPLLMAIAFLGAVALGVLGTLYPAWRASRTSPMEALKYE